MTENLFNVWHDAQRAKTTIIATSDLAARQMFALRWGWLSDMEGYWNFIEGLNTEFIN
jgi:hypothetical protein